MDFSHLQKLEIKNNTAECVLYEVVGEPTFILKPATQSNSPYFNALLRSSKQKILKAKKGVVDNAMLKHNREEDRALYPKHVIIGWKNVVDSSGTEVPFSIQNCETFLQKLPDWLFDKIRDFAASNENFVEEDFDVEVVSKK